MGEGARKLNLAPQGSALAHRGTRSGHRNGSPGRVLRGKNRAESLPWVAGGGNFSSPASPTSRGVAFKALLGGGHLSSNFWARGALGAPSLGRVGGHPPLRAPGRSGWGSHPQGTAGRRPGTGWGRRSLPRWGRQPLARPEATPEARRPAGARAPQGFRWRCAPRCWTGSLGSTPPHSSRAWVLRGEGSVSKQGCGPDKPPTPGSSTLRQIGN